MDGELPSGAFIISKITEDTEHLREVGSVRLSELLRQVSPRPLPNRTYASQRIRLSIY